MKTLLLVFISFFCIGLNAQNTSKKKTQEVNFSEMSLKGTVRNPDGAYLVQKKGMKFRPLYKIKSDIDEKIRNTVFSIN